MVKKIIKILLISIIGIALLAGICYALLYFHIVKAPAVISDLTKKLPAIKTDTTNNLQERELQKIKQENDTLKRSMSEKKAEMEGLQKKIADNEALQQADKKAFEDYKNQIINLNEKLSSTNTAKPGKNNAYKDMAGYFNEMNAKEAADLLSRLGDDDIIGILNEMKTDVAAELLQKMPRDKAATISRKMLVTTPQ